MKTVGELKDSVAGLLQGTNLNNITNLNGALERAARTLTQQVDIPESSGREAITLYDGVFDYLAPTTIFGGALVDLRPQGVSRSPLDYVYKKPVELFDRTKHLLPNGYMITFESNKGVRLMRVSTPKPFPRVILDQMNDDTNWVAGGSASGLNTDETVYYQSPASLRFTLTGASLGTLTKNLPNALNIPTYEDVAVGFLAIRTPSIANLTSVAVRVGSSASAYDEVSETVGFLGAFQVDEWLLVAFDFSASTSTGGPDWTAIDYLQVRVTHSGTITNFRVGGFFLALPSPHEVLFQSAAVFLHTDNTLSNTIVNDEDQIILADAAYTLYEFESAISVSEQSNGGNPTGVSQSYHSKLYGPMMRKGMSTSELGLYALYKANNPSEQMRMVGSWYDDDDVQGIDLR